MNCLLFFSLYSRVYTSNNSMWSKVRKCFLKKNSGVTECSSSKSDKSDLHITSEEEGKFDTIKPTNELSINYKENLEYTDYFRVMFENITSNLKSEVEFDSMIYEKYVSYKTEVLENQKPKSYEGNYMYESGLYLSKPLEYKQDEFEIHPNQRIHFVKMLTKEVTKDVLRSAPEIVGMTFKFIEVLDRLNDKEFLSLLLQFDFCINVMKEEPREKVYKNIIKDISKNVKNVEEYKSMCIFLPSCKIYQSLHNVDQKVFNDLEFRRHHVKKLSKKLCSGLDSIYFILSPNDAFDLFTKLMNIQMKVKNYVDNFDPLLIAQCSKLLVHFFPEIFDYELKLDVDDMLFQLQKNNSDFLIDNLKLIKKSLCDCRVNK